MGSGKKVRIGVFGAYRGMTMIRVLAKHPDAELVAICDKFEPLLEKCRRVADETGTKLCCYKDFDEFFNHDMDAVVLANYANEHAPYACRLLLSGRHVTSEVLPVETLSQAVELVEAVEKSGRIYTYAENYCYFAATQEMKRLYMQGDIGEFMHGEGEYIHNCEYIWPEITYGDKTHWRNRLYSSFYCTHSLGPIISITGTRPVRVVGFETPNAEYMAQYGQRSGTSAMIVMQMNNGATVKSLHGHLKREPWLPWYCIYGKKGMMESDRWHQNVYRLNVFRDGDGITETEISYRPKPRVDTRLSRETREHGGGDFYTMHYFLEKILGRPDGEECIDVYQALDMGLPGILAYRSICNGNTPIDMPDFRRLEDREKFRNDNWCTNPEVAGDNLAPLCSFGSPDISDEVYKRVEKIWKDRTGYK